MPLCQAELLRLGKTLQGFGCPEEGIASPSLASALTGLDSSCEKECDRKSRRWAGLKGG